MRFSDHDYEVAATKYDAVVESGKKVCPRCLSSLIEEWYEEGVEPDYCFICNGIPSEMDKEKEREGWIQRELEDERIIREEN